MASFREFFQINRKCMELEAPKPVFFSDILKKLDEIKSA